VIVELDPPPPLTSVAGIPPLEQDADLTSWKKHRTANVFPFWPSVLAEHPRFLSPQTRHRVVGANSAQLIPKSEQFTVVRTDLNT
jgi:hypothetical protein